MRRLGGPNDRAVSTEDSLQTTCISCGIRGAGQYHPRDGQYRKLSEKRVDHGRESIRIHRL